MKTGFKVRWSIHSIDELESTFQYLYKEFNEREVLKLQNAIDAFLELIIENPYSFQLAENSTEVRKLVIMKYNTMYFSIDDDIIYILSFFSNRQNPEKIIFGDV
jgi:plasmid stabilization system protein ParE